MEKVYSIAEIARTVGMVPQTLKYQVENIWFGELGMKSGRTTYYSVDDVREILERLRSDRQQKLADIERAIAKLNGK